jgi:hypothetical protein
MSGIDQGVKRKNSIKSDIMILVPLCTSYYMVLLIMTSIIVEVFPSLNLRDVWEEGGRTPARISDIVSIACSARGSRYSCRWSKR